MTTEIIVEDNDDGESEAAQNAALAAAVISGAAASQADSAKQEAEAARAEAESAAAQSGAASALAADTAANAVTGEEVDAKIESGFDRLASLLSERMVAPAPAVEPVAVAEAPKPPDAAPKSVKKDSRKTFAERWYGVKKEEKPE